MEINKSANVTAVVDAHNTAKAVGSGSLEVFATPMMIALMEEAACKCLEGELEPGQTSVGIKISAEHSAASPIGARITAEATIRQISGKRIEYTVIARDDTKEIGRGEHMRVIVEEGKFMERLSKKS